MFKLVLTTRATQFLLHAKDPKSSRFSCRSISLDEGKIVGSSLAQNDGSIQHLKLQLLGTSGNINRYSTNASQSCTDSNCFFQNEYEYLSV